MYLAVLRVTTDEEIGRALLARHQLAVQAAWCPGELAGLERVSAESGFNTAVADAESAGDVAERVERWLAANEQFLRDLTTSGAVGTLDVGISAGTERPNRSVCFAPALLQRFAD